MDSLLNLIYQFLPVLFALVLPPTIFVICDYNRRQTLTGLPEIKSTATLKNLHPAEVAALYAEGNFRPEFIWAEIVGLAIKKTLSIEKSGHALVWKPYYFYQIEYLFSVATPITDAEFAKLDPLSQKIMATIFPFEKKTNLFSNREYLAAKMPEIGEAVRLSLFRKGLLSPEAAALRSVFLASGAFLLALGILVIDLGFIWRLSLAVSGLMALLFALMTRDTTPAGDKMIQKIKQLRRQKNGLKRSKNFCRWQWRWEWRARSTNAFLWRLGPISFPTCTPPGIRDIRMKKDFTASGSTHNWRIFLIPAAYGLMPSIPAAKIKIKKYGE
jgi:hypothetical protein